MTKYLRFNLLGSILLVLTLMASACGGGTTTDAAGDLDSDEAPSSADTSGSSTGITGEFLISGSSTVFPIVLRQVEQFVQAEPGLAIAVEGPGSGDGAKKFCSGEVPIANASRTFKDSEIEICQENGIEFIELRRGIDGITVVTSPENDAIECLSFNDIYALISDEAIGFDNWADANALTSTWGGQEFPDVPLDIFGPGEESGTFDSFNEIVIEGVAGGKTGLDPDSRPFVEIIRPDYTSNANDNVIVEGVANSQYSLGWVGYAYAEESADAGKAKLLAVSKEDGGECVVPTPETIASAEFPIARYLYTYVNAASVDSEPGVKELVDYMLSDAGLESVAAVGYIDLTDHEIDKAATIWSNRTTGRSWE